MSVPRFVERIPTAAEHRAMFEAVGWTPYTEKETEIALNNTLFGAVVYMGDTLIGMGRVIGDGGKFFYIQDVAVHPDHQRQGIGSLIMDSLLAAIRREVPGEPFVGLFATGVAIPFYQGYTFQVQPFGLTGMGTILRKLAPPQE